VSGRESLMASQRHKHKHTPDIPHELLASRAVRKSAGEAIAAVYVAGGALVDTPGLADDIILAIQGMRMLFIGKTPMGRSPIQGMISLV